MGAVKYIIEYCYLGEWMDTGDEPMDKAEAEAVCDAYRLRALPQHKYRVVPYVEQA